MDTCKHSNKGNSCKQLKLWWARLDPNQRTDDYESLHSILYWIPTSNIN